MSAPPESAAKADPAASVWVCTIYYRPDERLGGESKRVCRPMGLAQAHLIGKLAELEDNVAGYDVQALLIGGGPVYEAANLCLDPFVTMDQAAAAVGITKRAMEKYRHRGMPRPCTPGGGGRPARWRWSEFRPWLEQTFGMDLHPHCPQRVRFHGNLDQPS